MKAISADASLRALKRLLANGPLTDVPKRPADQQLLVAMAAAQFEPGKAYREGEVNDTLKAWIGTFCEPWSIDHVTLRRMLVDSRLIARTKSGSTYEVNLSRIAEVEAVQPLVPADVLAAIRRERESRKSRHAA